MAGQPIVFGGDRVATVDEALAAAFRAGDRLVVVQETGDLLHVPAAEHAAAGAAVDAAVAAFAALARAPTSRSPSSTSASPTRLADDDVVAPIVDRQRRRRRPRRGRRPLDDPARADRDDARRHGRRPAVVARLAAAPRRRRSAASSTTGWSVEARRAPLGVVGFVFEGRPNVFADATGVLRTGNTVVMRIGSDALGTAEAIVDGTPSLRRWPPPGCRPARCRSCARRPGRPAGRCSPIAGWPSPSPAARAPRSPSSAPSPARPAPRSACTAPAGRGSSPARDADAERFRAAVVQLARPQGVQHAERLLHPGRRAPTSSTCSSTRIDEAAERRGTRGPAARRGVVAAGRARRRASTTEVKVRRADGEHVEPAASTIADRRPRAGVGVGALARGDARRDRRRRRRRSSCATATARASSPRSSATTPPSTTASTPPSTRRSSATASPAGSTASTPSTRRSSACRTGRAAGCWPAAACCPATRCTPCATAPTSPTRSCTADGPPCAARARRRWRSPCDGRVQRRRTCAPSRPSQASDRRAHRRPTATAPTASTAPPATTEPPSTTAGARRPPSLARRGEASTTQRRLRCSRSSAPPTSTSRPTTCAWPTTRTSRLLDGTVTISTAGRPRRSTSSPSTPPTSTVEAVTVDGAPGEFEQTTTRAVSIRPAATGRRRPTPVVHRRDLPRRRARLGVGVRPRRRLVPDRRRLVRAQRARRRAHWLPSNDHPSDKATWRFELTVPDGVDGDRQRRTSSSSGPAGGRHDVGLGAARADGDLPRPAADRRLRGARRRARPATVPLDQRAPCRRRRADAAVLRPDRRPDRLLRAAVRSVPARPVRAGVHREPVRAWRWRPRAARCSPATTSPSGTPASSSSCSSSHELAHQWFGDAVTPADWSDLWLNESFATYAQWLWLDHVGLIGPRARRPTAQPRASARSPTEPTGEPSAENLFGYERYDGGAVVVHALRGELGDDAFFELLQRWVADNDGTSRTTRRLHRPRRGGRRPRPRRVLRRLAVRRRPSRPSTRADPLSGRLSGR